MACLRKLLHKSLYNCKKCIFKSTTALHLISPSCSKEKDRQKRSAKASLWPAKYIKEVISNPKQPSCKKVCSPQKAKVKKDVKSRLAAKKWL